MALQLVTADNINYILQQQMLEIDYLIRMATNPIVFKDDLRGIYVTNSFKKNVHYRLSELYQSKDISLKKANILYRAVRAKAKKDQS